MFGGNSPGEIAMKMIIGLILVLLWIPSIFWSEINNKGNNKEIKKLKKDMETALLKTGKIVNDNFTTNIYNNNKILIKSAIGSSINTNEYRRYSRNIKNSKGRTIRTEYYNNWSRPYNIRNNFKSFNIKLDDGNILEVDRNKISFNDLKNLKVPVYKNDLSIKNNTRIYGNTIYPYYGRYNYMIGDKRFNLFKIPTNETITVFAKNDRLDKIDGDTSSLFYKGIKTKKEIINDKKSSNTLQRWLFRIGTFFMLFIGLSLIASPLKEILEGTSNVLNFPILNLLKPIVNALGGIVIFLWDTFSFLGSLILTVVLTFIVYFLVNYTVFAGIGLGVVIVILLIPQFMNK